MDRLDLQVVIVYVGVNKTIICTVHKVCELATANEEGAVISRCGFWQHRLSRKRHEQPKVSGSKVTIVCAAAEAWG